MAEERVFHIFALSDSKGLTVTMVTNVVAAQFREAKTKVHLVPEINSNQQIDEVIKQAVDMHAMIIHSFVKHEFADYIWHEGRMQNVEVVSILGPVLNRMSSYLQGVPAETPGLFTQLNRNYFRRIETTEFAIKHDDGAYTNELDKAELVLLGVSRTFKTPLSIYLAYKGWFVANIPIVLGMPLPEKVYTLPPERIFCLTTDPVSLSRLRGARNEYLKGLAPQYANFEHVSKEIRYANSLFAPHPEWQQIKVTARPIEEIASTIIKIFRRSELEKTRDNK